MFYFRLVHRSQYMTSMHCLLVNTFYDSLGKKHSSGFLFSNATRTRVMISSLFSWTPVPLFFFPCLMLPNLHLNMAKKFFPCSSAPSEWDWCSMVRNISLGFQGQTFREQFFSKHDEILSPKMWEQRAHWCIQTGSIHYLINPRAQLLHFVHFGWNVLH